MTAMKLPFSRRSVEGNVFQLVREPSTSGQITDGLQNPEDGAVVVFEGVVRNNAQDKAVRFLEYDAYEPMALKKLEEIGALAKTRIRDPGYRNRAPAGTHGNRRMQHGNRRGLGASGPRI